MTRPGSAAERCAGDLLAAGWTGRHNRTTIHEPTQEPIHSVFDDGERPRVGGLPGVRPRLKLLRYVVLAVALLEPRI
jgi:hypothetical protein